MSGTRLVTVAAVALAVVLALGLEWAARRRGSRVPRLADLCAAAMGFEVRRVPVGRIAVVLLWCWAGWHLFAR